MEGLGVEKVRKETLTTPVLARKVEKVWVCGKKLLTS